MRTHDPAWGEKRVPAAFGGMPIRGGRPVGTAQLAPLPIDTFAELVRPIHRPSTQYVEYLSERLEGELAELHSVRHVVLVNNASVGLLLALRSLCEGREGAIVMPSFSFRGLPFFARMLGRSIEFVDVEPRFGTMAPDSLECVLQNRSVGAVLAVHNVDRPCRVAELEQICGNYGVPLMFDSVYSVFNEVRGRPIGNNGTGEVFSLHATKLINGFEGGYLTTDDANFASKFRSLLQPSAGAVGLPSRLDPFHVAAALSSLSQIREVVGRNERRYWAYAEALAGVSELVLWPHAPGSSNFGSVIVEVMDSAELSRDQLVKLLCAEGYLARPYYGPALHQMSTWADCGRQGGLPVTSHLATRLMQLPVGDTVELEDCGEVVRLLVGFLDQRKQILDRFSLGVQK